MCDKLYESAKAFSKLLNIRYKIIVGRKGQLVNINLEFEATEFVHLTGLHKLTDNEFLRTAPREKVFQAALNNNINYSTISKSVRFLNIYNRIEYFAHLESMLDNNEIIFKYNTNRNTFSLIQADYLLQSQYNQKNMYIFIDKQPNSDTYFCRSFFPKGKKDYTVGQAKYTLLYKEKINKQSGKSIIQYNKLPLSSLS